MPSLLPIDKLQAGKGLSAAIIQIGSFAEPVTGGILVTAAGSARTAGSAPAFAVDAASFAISAASLALMRGRQATGGAAEPAATAAEPGALALALGSDMAAGGEETGIWQFFLGARVLQAIVLIAVLANFVIAGAFEVALPALAHARFGPAGYGALIACFGIGSLGGTLTAARLSGLSFSAG